MRVLNVVGARPNFVKIAPLIAAMREFADVEPLLVHTGQHYDDEMSGTFLRDLNIPVPDFSLRIGEISREKRLEEMRKGLIEIMRRARPDVVLVVGDVDSTLAGALASHDLLIPIAHVEAGLRSFDCSTPEEINRIAVDSLSSLLFASEPSGVENLLREGYPSNRIFMAGNVMIDTLRQLQATARKSAILTALGLCDENGAAQKYILATLHRPSTVDDATVLDRVWSALEEIATTIPVLFPSHPRTRSRLRLAGLVQEHREYCEAGGLIRLIPPQSYPDFLRLESNAALVMTDSGGVQEETTALGVPCLTLRNNTERPITVTHGTNKLVGLDPLGVVAAARQLLGKRSDGRRLPVLWDGRSAERIVRVLRRCFGSSQELPPRFTPFTASRPESPCSTPAHIV